MTRKLTGLRQNWLERTRQPSEPRRNSPRKRTDGPRRNEQPNRRAIASGMRRPRERDSKPSQRRGNAGNGNHFPEWTRALRQPTGSRQEVGSTSTGGLDSARGRALRKRRNLAPLPKPRIRPVSTSIEIEGEPPALGSISHYSSRSRPSCGTSCQTGPATQGPTGLCREYRRSRKVLVSPRTYWAIQAGCIPRWIGTTLDQCPKARHSLTPGASQDPSLATR
jgi:hypothetical protein